MLNVTIKISGDREQIERLKKLGADLTDWSAPLKLTGKELKTYYSKTVFGSEGAETGQEWKGLSPAYAKYKAKHYPNKGILVAGGTMQRSFRAQSNNTSLTIDNTDEKFKWHQLGTGYGGRATFGIANTKGGRHIGRGRNLAARPMLAATPMAKDIVHDIFDKDVKDKLKRAG